MRTYWPIAVILSGMLLIAGIILGVCTLGGYPPDNEALTAAVWHFVILPQTMR
jgi:hypothetical protein